MRYDAAGKGHEEGRSEAFYFQNIFLVYKKLKMSGMDYKENSLTNSNL